MHWRTIVSLLLLTAPAVCVAQQRRANPARAAVDTVLATAEPPGPLSAEPYAVGGLPRALVSNTIGLLSLTNAVPALLGASLTLTAHSLDDRARRAIGDRAEGVGDLGDIMGDRYVFSGSIVGLFAVGQIAPPGRFRRVTFDLAQGLVINSLVATVLKRSVGRQRPDSSNFSSFPSGHTSSFVATAMILYRHLGPRVGVPATLAAAFVAVSRVEDNEHFLSDIVAGATLGFIIGRTVTARLGQNPAGRAGRVSISPIPAPGGGGVHVRIVI